MKYRRMTEQDLPYVVEKYIDYYNGVEDRCWTYEKAYRRIHQVLSTEDSMCMLQMDRDNMITGFLMGYFKEFDDIKGYFLEEIVIFTGHQGKGHGTDFLKTLEKAVRENNASIIELNCVNDVMHEHFYTKSGFSRVNNLAMMSKLL